jgi:hypothetical protein
MVLPTTKNKPVINKKTKNKSFWTAAMTGSIAEAFYGIPKGIEAKALSYLTDDLKEIVRLFNQHYRQ